MTRSNFAFLAAAVNLSTCLIPPVIHPVSLVSLVVGIYFIYEGIKYRKETQA